MLRRKIRTPGEPSFWILIFGDCIVFTVFFLTFAWYRGKQPEVFAQSQATLNRWIRAASLAVGPGWHSKTLPQSHPQAANRGSSRTSNDPKQDHRPQARRTSGTTSQTLTVPSIAVPSVCHRKLAKASPATASQAQCQDGRNHGKARKNRSSNHQVQRWQSRGSATRVM